MFPFDEALTDTPAPSDAGRLVHLTVTALAVLAGPALTISGLAHAVEIDQDGARQARRSVDVVVDLHGDTGEAARHVLAEVADRQGNVTVEIDATAGPDGQVADATGHVRVSGHALYSGPVELGL